MRLQPALTAVGETACTPAHNRVCSTDGTQGWVPIKDPREATLVRAAARLTDRHTSWTTLLRFDRASRQALHTAAADAAAAGGVVLLLHDDHAVTALAPLDVRGVRVTITGLEKPESWELVAAVDAAQQGE